MLLLHAAATLLFRLVDYAPCYAMPLRLMRRRYRHNSWRDIIATTHNSNNTTSRCHVRLRASAFAERCRRAMMLLMPP